MSFLVALNIISMDFLVALITHNMGLFVALTWILSVNFVVCKHFTNHNFKITECTWKYSPNANFCEKKKTNYVTVSFSTRENLNFRMLWLLSTKALLKSVKVLCAAQFFSLSQQKWQTSLMASDTMSRSKLDSFTFSFSNSFFTAL